MRSAGLNDGELAAAVTGRVGVQQKSNNAERKRHTMTRLQLSRDLKWGEFIAEKGCCIHVTSAFTVSCCDS
jgi:riboflavin synthase alpha subunit